jgi:hypothetical protein
MSHPFFIHWGIVSIQKPNNRTELVLNLRQLFKKKEEFHPFFIHHPVGTTLSSAPNPTRTNLGTCVFLEGSHVIFHPIDVSQHPNQTRTWGNLFFSF